MTATVAVLLLWVAVPFAGAGGFTPAPTIDADGVDYYLAGAPDGSVGETDIPGHHWVQLR